MLSDRPVHENADKLKSEKDLKEGIKTFIEHRFERRGKLSWVYSHIK